MGLDMYLSKKIFVGGNYKHRNDKGIIDITVGEENKPIKINLDKLTYVEESVGYWRKANAIHNWFVNNVQEGNDDCGNYYVSSKNLQELYALCQEVKKVIRTAEGKIVNGQTLKYGQKETLLLRLRLKTGE